MDYSCLSLCNFSRFLLNRVRERLNETTTLVMTVGILPSTAVIVNNNVRVL